MNQIIKSEILKFVETNSYALAADYFGMTRGQIAGVIWRHKNPGKTSLGKRKLTHKRFSNYANRP